VNGTKLHVLNNVFAQVNQLVAKIDVNFKMFKNIIREFNTSKKKRVECNKKLDVIIIESAHC